MTTWDERFRTGAYPSDPDPSPVLREHTDTAAGRRALDVACGTGRNAVFLAEQGDEVDALDQSREGLRVTRERAEQRGVGDRLNLIQADAREFAYPENRYDVVTISFFRTLDRLIRIVVTMFGSAAQVSASGSLKPPHCLNVAVKNHNNPYE